MSTYIEDLDLDAYGNILIEVSAEFGEGIFVNLEHEETMSGLQTVWKMQNQSRRNTTACSGYQGAIPVAESVAAAISGDARVVEARLVQREHAPSYRDMPIKGDRGKDLKKLLLAGLLVFSCNAKAEWLEYLTAANGDVFFYDSARVQKEGDLVTVWSRIRYKTSVMAASSYQRFIRIDCSAYSETTLQSTFFIDKDWTTPAMATDTKEKPKKGIATDSATERLANIVCKA